MEKMQVYNCLPTLLMIVAQQDTGGLRASLHMTNRVDWYH
jgi:hypothetical protein